MTVRPSAKVGGVNRHVASKIRVQLPERCRAEHRSKRRERSRFLRSFVAKRQQRPVRSAQPPRTSCRARDARGSERPSTSRSGGRTDRERETAPSSAAGAVALAPARRFRSRRLRRSERLLRGSRESLRCPRRPRDALLFPDATERYLSCGQRPRQCQLRGGQFLWICRTNSRPGHRTARPPVKALIVAVCRAAARLFARSLRRLRPDRVAAAAQLRPTAGYCLKSLGSAGAGLEPAIRPGGTASKAAAYPFSPRPAPKLSKTRPLRSHSGGLSAVARTVSRRRRIGPVSFVHVSCDDLWKTGVYRVKERAFAA